MALQNLKRPKQNTKELRSNPREERLIKQESKPMASAPAIQEHKEPAMPIPIDAKPRRLLLKDDYAEIFQEVLRCEYLCRQRNLRYDRKMYLGDYDIRKRKEFLLDYLYSLCDLLNDSIQERLAIQEFG